MVKIKTAKGEEHAVDFCGISSLSGLLVFSMPREKTFVEYAVEFADPENTQTIEYYEGVELPIAYVGYTTLTSVSHDRQTDTVRIMLQKQ